MEREIYEFSPEDEPTGKRWDPLGAPNEECDNPPDQYLCKHDNESDKLKNLEKEQDVLVSSLFALTTHFAQVQFRLRQVVHAPPEAKEKLLKSLEEFAFRGIPDIGLVKEQIDEVGLVNPVRLKQNQHKELFSVLKGQIKDLEEYAFENGTVGFSPELLLERQKILLNELKTRINLDLDEQNLYSMTPADVSKQINSAVDQLITPLQLKEHLVTQLKTQIADLERFIDYLQANPKKHKGCSCNNDSLKEPFEKDSALGLIHKIATVLHIFTVLQLGCGVNGFRRNELKKTMKVNHWGDIRARLEMAIVKVKDTFQSQSHFEMRRSSITFDDSFNIELTTIIRKHLATSIRDLIQHGTCPSNNSSLVPLAGCFLPRNTYIESDIHAWSMILKYYYMKNGETYNSTPARKLSQSFNLDLVGSSPSSNKQNLLCCIGNIISTHTPYKRSQDSHFKAFICAALNSSKLVPWLNLIFTCKQLVKECYYPWSYVAKTGLQDSLRSLDTLTPYKFDLPVDLAVKQFQNIKDVFT